MTFYSSPSPVDIINRLTSGFLDKQLSVVYRVETTNDVPISCPRDAQNYLLLHPVGLLAFPSQPHHSSTGGHRVCQPSYIGQCLNECPDSIVGTFREGHLHAHSNTKLWSRVEIERSFVLVLICAFSKPYTHEYVAVLT